MLLGRKNGFIWMGANAAEQKIMQISPENVFIFWTLDMLSKCHRGEKWMLRGIATKYAWTLLTSFAPVFQRRLPYIIKLFPQENYFSEHYITGSRTRGTQ